MKKELHLLVNEIKGNYSPMIKENFEELND